MSEEKQIFAEFIADKTVAPERALELFEEYRQLLLSANSRVNLFSRKTEPEKLWTFHFYDSLLPLAYGFDFSHKKVLDLGTGGGLPGIPLAIMFPTVKVELLDSIGKKTAELERMIKKLDLDNCSVSCKRLEEIASGELYDVIISRSVKMTKPLLRKSLRLLQDGGYLLLYKAKSLEDEIFRYDLHIYDSVALPWRERKLVQIMRDEAEAVSAK